MVLRPMPAAEVTVTADQLRSMLARQLPALADEPIEHLSDGWDNIMFRIGRRHLARLPRRRVAVPLIEHEIRWVPVLAPRLPLPVPVPELAGEPSDGFPWPWSVVPWIAGRPLAVADDVDLRRAARSLGTFLAALHERAPDDAPANPVRGVPLRSRDAATEERLDALVGSVDVDALRPLWRELRDSTAHRGPPTWLHGDLHPMNVLVANGVPSGVIDFGDVTAGDPATDLAIAWIAFGRPDDRAVLYEAYGGVDDETDARARGWALTLATAYLAHGADHPTMPVIGEHALRNVLAGPG
jgi:aminoglycoside phosphotransferase (APT) family kinase protein